MGMFSWFQESSRMKRAMANATTTENKRLTKKYRGILRLQKRRHKQELKLKDSQYLNELDIKDAENQKMQSLVKNAEDIRTRSLEQIKLNLQLSADISFQTKRFWDNSTELFQVFERINTTAGEFNRIAEKNNEKDKSLLIPAEVSH